jgi:hypothetical protein
MTSAKNKKHLYCVVTNSRQMPNTILVHCDRWKKDKPSGPFWTDCDPMVIAAVPFDFATNIMNGLAYNGPRLMRVDTAIATLQAQRARQGRAPISAHDLMILKTSLEEKHHTFAP